MPLIIITGHPTSGKTHRATQLHDYLKNRITSLPPTHPSSSLRTHLISDHTLSIPRTVYNLESKSAHERSNNASEKDARATIYAAVKRVLSPRDVVVLDGANYIKGWRYQLFCEAKAVRSPCCVVRVGCGVEKSRSVNEGRLAKRESEGEEGIEEEEKPYERDTWENLVFRYEEPNAMARWDSPLFAVVWEDEAPLCEEIWDAVVGSEDYLYELDKSTQAILNRILEWGKDHPGEGGGEVTVGEGGDELVVELPASVVGLPALQRIRRQFISLNRKNAVPAKRIRESFVAYLNDSFEAL
ncbi:RNA polymerase II Elongator complex associated protein-like protein Kti12 [Halenospora varia]|nr:RNA polymerase II Elongator complex associated protein-like protein Kti12 [Halenospora varia]